MNQLLSIIRNEPALISGLVTALIALFTAFGLDLTNEQVAGITGVSAAVLAIAVRSQVTPSSRVSAEKDKKTGADIAGEAASDIPEKAPVEVTAVDETSNFVEGR